MFLKRLGQDFFMKKLDKNLQISYREFSENKEDGVAVRELSDGQHFNNRQPVELLVSSAAFKIYSKNE